MLLFNSAVHHYTTRSALKSVGGGNPPLSKVGGHIMATQHAPPTHVPTSPYGHDYHGSRGSV